MSDKPLPGNAVPAGKPAQPHPTSTQIPPPSDPNDPFSSPAATGVDVEKGVAPQGADANPQPVPPPPEVNLAGTNATASLPRGELSPEQTARLAKGQAPGAAKAESEPKKK